MSVFGLGSMEAKITPLMGFLHIPTVVITLLVLGSVLPGEVGVVDVMVTRKIGMLIKSSCKHLNCAFVYSLI